MEFSVWWTALVNNVDFLPPHLIRFKAFVNLMPPANESLYHLGIIVLIAMFFMCEPVSVTNFTPKRNIMDDFKARISSNFRNLPRVMRFSLIDLIQRNP
jgi:hypothetical protein